MSAGRGDGYQSRRLGLTTSGTLPLRQSGPACHPRPVRPLDPVQQGYFEQAAAGRPAWVNSRSKRGAAALLTGALTTAAVAGLGVVLDASWIVPTSIVGCLALLLVGAAILVQPDRLTAALIRNTYPSAEDFQRGVSSFQIDGGRVPRPDEKPPPPYWRR